MKELAASVYRYDSHMTIGIAMDDRKRPSKDANQGDVGVFDSQ